MAARSCASRWVSPSWFLLDLAVLVLGVSHGLLGVRSALIRRLGDGSLALGLFAGLATMTTLLLLRTVYTMLLYPA